MWKSIFGLLGILISAPAASQSSGMPPNVAAAVRGLGVALDDATFFGTAALYHSLHRAAPSGGVTRTADIRYGSDERHRLDVYRPSGYSGPPMPVLVFIHGGSFVRGDKQLSPSRTGCPYDVTCPYHDNIGDYFAGRGVLTIAANYRLAPQHPWPAGAEDVAAVVAWAHANDSAHGGDPSRIVLMGYSAGAAHVAAYSLTRRMQPSGGTGIAGLVLLSGPYEPYEQHICRSVFTILGGQCPPGYRAYYGSNESRYRERSILDNLDAPALPVLIAYGEVEYMAQQVQSAVLFHRLCNRHRVCPQLLMLRNHNHYSGIFSINTPDESLSGPVLDFVNSATAR